MIKDPFAFGGETMRDDRTSLVWRGRRLRRSSALRAMVRETHLRAEDLIYPLFVVDGKSRVEAIRSMPGQRRRSVDSAVDEACRAYDKGILSVLLFGIPESKSPHAEAALNPDGVVARAVRAIKRACPELTVVTDVCVCSYTSAGHCGILRKGESVPANEEMQSVTIDNDETIAVLADIAAVHAAAGADIVAPSAMMDGMVTRIRLGLDAAGYAETPIMSYAVKYASSFYGPFRDAADGAPAFGDRRTHQMDPANAREAIREAAADVSEGADMIMVKPAMAYLDVLRRLRERFTEIPIVAYNVSGEYAMVKAAAEKGWIDEHDVVLEFLTGIKRAGADLIISYHAMEVAEWLKR